MIYFVYLLKCWKSDTAYKNQIPKHGHIIYTGYTSDVIRRFREHRKGKKYSSRTPYTAQFKGRIDLGYLELYNDKKEATDREKEIKKFSRDQKVKLIQEMDKAVLKYLSRLF